MKLPEILNKYFTNKQPKAELLLSLLFDIHAVYAAVWYVGDGGQPHLVSYDIKSIDEDDWEVRGKAADRAIAHVEEKAGSTKAIRNVVLGLPSVYLTDDGDITKDHKQAIRDVMRELQLKPIGFVPVHQALAFMIKKDDGVPASVIMIHVTKDVCTVYLYRVGKLVGTQTFSFGPEAADRLETILKKHQDHDVLPSRILLYGADTDILEKTKTFLMKHPWTTKANFLHFPKIDIVSPDGVVGAVCFAGASELSKTIKDDTTIPVEPVVSQDILDQQEEEEISEEEDQKQNQDDQNERETNLEEEERQEEEDEMKEAEDTQEHEEAEAEGQNDGKSDEEEIEEELLEEEEEEKLDAQAQTRKIDTLKQEDTDDEENEEREEREEPLDQEGANVIEVEPSRLGFQTKKDVLEEEKPVQSKPQPRSSNITLRAVPIGNIIALVLSLSRRIPLIPILAALGVGLGIWWVSYWVTPKVTVTILVDPSTVTQKASVTVDLTATVVDSNAGIIPGTKLEHEVTGSKTVPVEGKKNIGDPAKGTVTIYNKVTSEKTFPKGTVVVGGGLSFSLDADVKVASATADPWSGITFSTAKAGITAVTIGSSGNLPKNTEFVFKDISKDIAAARNEEALSGGTSKQVTVVSRNDIDSVVDVLTDELVAKAKEELAGAIGGGQILIDGTVDTTVENKSFDKELDEEAGALTGTLTITMTGISYKEEDMKSYVLAFLSDKIPDGYVTSPAQTDTKVTDMTLSKDKGSVDMNISVKSVALPSFDIRTVASDIAGKPIQSAIDVLKSRQGVVGVEYNLRGALSKSRFPANKNNFSISIAER